MQVDSIEAQILHFWLIELCESQDTGISEFADLRPDTDHCWLLHDMHQKFSMRTGKYFQ